MSTMEQPGLSQIADIVAPLTLARDRVVPVPTEIAGLFPEGGLVRGRIMSCQGPAATSLALSLVAPASAAGSWLAIIDVPSVGLDAASELGVPLERIVAVSAGGAERWPDVVVAASEGFDLIVTRVPRDLRAATARSMAMRLQRRGTVLVVIGDPGELHCDGVLDTTRMAWEGLEDGAGRLCRRTVDIQLTGRRFPGRVDRTVQLAGQLAG